ncbi:MAG: hypothetical protein APG10_01270 [Candidatus Methanofastidiosum methylothiophilum]|uniref:DUF1576 domain-containing protein n=1 Tax=Candidatus Methanofastidiosum methylothiophilum TaxID=1705564 RepID=A0A150IJ43_9EURY|nr:MAG: hypothetical protein APG10_01270 [Candidatus Methanofastidiosum methylthiophilus]
MNNEKIYIFLICYFLVIIGFSFVIYGFTDVLQGFIKIQISASRLISDYFEIAGIGGTLLNASILSLLSILLLLILKVRMGGAVLASVFTIFGFALFGKNIPSVLSLWFGVFIASKIAGKRFIEYIFIALFGSALSPVFSLISFETGLNPVLAIFSGVFFTIIIGSILPSLAIYMLRLHQGYNLYNVGMTAGFLSIFISSILRNVNIDLKLLDFWSKNITHIDIILIPLTCILFIVLGLIYKPRQALKSFFELQKESGRLPSDFYTLYGYGAVFINIAALTLIYYIYVILTKSPTNGPVLGGLFTILGFAAFGKNLRNCLPVLIGVILTAILLKKPLNSPAIILGALFSTTLAPLAGSFGIIAGLIAGALHIILVQFTAGWVGGLNLYNNGFAGGLVATFLVAIIDWLENSSLVKIKSKIKE